MHVPGPTPTDADSLLDDLRSPGLAVMLYGSTARGDATADSDVDLLQIVDPRTEGHYSVGMVSVTMYTPGELAAMCAGGSLFALHLVTEGRILRDPDGILAETLAHFRRPDSYEPVWAELRVIAQLLGTAPQHRPEAPEGMARLGLYLVRTAAILAFIELKGRPSFSIPELADGLGLPNMILAFSGREDPAKLDWDRVETACGLLSHLLGSKIENPHVSLEAFAVNTELTNPVAARAALRLLSGSKSIGYGDLLLDLLIPAHE